MTVVIDAAISYSWLTSLIIVCTTTMVLLLIAAYKEIMEKLSSNANKVDEYIKAISMIKASSEIFELHETHILLGY